ncbi:class III lanthionine synthetase LanKC N-terminal domain-containing protein [Saccharothrix obliqua]|uniref:class III lanthionine synthetase LanKC N-terminal domain-containing protein n=1 Tax=Saccharothrix obliqua TaxID=2861747 RepID=UPI001C5EF51C|nr:lanthionine synthetase LanC family protein [Saccharothrix obliqua]MBW4717515.1 hypothetical protein [Saccharothrix obliqua]
MNEVGSRAWVEHAVRQGVGTRHAVTAGSVWLVVRPDSAVLPAHGWKLHVSSRVANFPALVETLVPLLAAEGCLFKLACSVEVLRDLNGGLAAPATVGKAFTVYPHQDRVRELGLLLANALRGHQGPRVLSDRRVLANSPVYYRYGSMTDDLRHDRFGRPEIRLRGPRGEEFDGLAGLSYRQPPWATDPFAGGEPGRGGDDTLVGGHYRVTAGVRESAQGNVYRAVDTRDGRAVVVKQARAHVAEFGERNDSRLRLRNERRVLDVLAGVAGVPRFVDHFRHGEDEFLVTDDRGARNLADDVRLGGPYAPGGGVRGLDRLAAAVAGILVAVHERGVTMRDLTPANTITGESISVVDFGLAAHAGLHLPGSTPGYAPARQVRDETPRDTDDLHALGMVLTHALTGMPPVIAGDDLDLPRTRALQALRLRFGSAPVGIGAVVVALLDDDAGRAREAVRRIAAGGRPAPAVIPVPARPAMTPVLAAEVVGNLRADLLDRVDRVVRAEADTLAYHDFSAYTGSSGMGLELLHHLPGRPDVRRRVAELAEFTARVARRPGARPGLYGGTTGADVFLRAAADFGVGAADRAVRGLPPPEWDATPADLVDGQAGVGLGHLRLHRVDGDAEDLAVARRCLRAVLAEEPAGRVTEAGVADAGLGRAHGLAGAVEFLLRHAEHTGEPRALDAAAHRAHHLARHARALVAEARDPAAEPMTTSWCRGLAGIGQVLALAGRVLDEPGLTALARSAADACAARVPGMASLGRCCGVIGVGEFFLDLAVAGGSERHWEAALDVASHLLLRTGGPPDHPTFAAPGANPTTATSWAHGLVGALAFFRRLAGGGDPVSATGELWDPPTLR